MTNYYRITSPAGRTWETIGDQMTAVYTSEADAVSEMESMVWDESWGVEPTLEVERVEMAPEDMDGITVIE